MTFSVLREKYTYKEVIGAKLQGHWDWDNMRWHLLLCFEGRRFQWGGSLLIKAVPESGYFPSRQMHFCDEFKLKSPEPIVFFDLSVSIKPIRGWEGWRELTRQTTPAPGVYKEWEMTPLLLRP
jgi:hypothetical protein